MEPVFIGEKFFNFIEVNYNSDIDSLLMRKIFTHDIDGVVVKGVFTAQEVDTILEATKVIDDNDKLFTSNGQVFPMPFATIRNKEDNLDRYITKRDKLDSSLFQSLKDKIQEFFEKIGGDFNVSVPKITAEGKTGRANFGNFRFFQPDLGGLFVHCGNLFQEDSPVYYDVVEDMDKDGQLSFFLALQYPENGGELSIYDMLWPEVNGKDDFENNEYVLNAEKEKLYLKDVKQFKVKPNPGDILVFRGGPIWHRVEPILGSKPRITFGGFMNFSKDGKSFFYWS